MTVNNFPSKLPNRSNIGKKARSVYLVVLGTLMGIFLSGTVATYASAYPLNSTSEMQTSNATITAAMINGISINSTKAIINPNMTNSTMGLIRGSTNQTNITDMTAIPPGNTTGTSRRH